MPPHETSRGAQYVEFQKQNINILILCRICDSNSVIMKIMWYMFTVGPCPFRGYISKWQNSFKAVTSYELQVVVAAEAREQASKQ
jgi:hypothetical protein